jgi:tetratricopeptide (TPR) repeat protein
MRITLLVQRTFVPLLLLLTHLDTNAQSLEQWTRWGDAAMEVKQYYGASRFFDGALAIEPGRMGLQWKQAEACRLSHQYDRAAELYEKVYRKDQGRTYTQALRWLAEMQLCAGDPIAAQASWSKVLKREKDEASVLHERALNALEGITLALEPTSAGSVEIVHEPAPLNSFDSEFGARYGPDGTLYFAGLHGAVNGSGEVEDTMHYRTRIHRSSGVSGNWSAPEPLEVVGDGDVANPTWTLDGQRILFTYCPVNGTCRIHVSPVGDGLLDPVPLEGLGDAMSTQPMIVDWNDREMLLFVSDRADGKGGTDIWQARLENGRAVEVHPLNGKVNTAGNERSPWFVPSTSTLWFSSDHLPGHGGYDVFTSTLDNDVFGTPENAGTPINSPANDLYPMLDTARGEGWITSNRAGSFAAKGETCCNDLYRWDISRMIRANVPGTTDTVNDLYEESALALATLQRKFPLRLYFHNDEPGPRSRSTTTELDYQDTYLAYRSLLPDYLNGQEDPNAMTRFFTEEVDHGMALLGELTRALITTLDAGRSVTIDVRGHASPLARNDYNIDLSKRRIQSLRNHLRTVLGGRLTPYLDGNAPNAAMLTVHELPFGEDRAASSVSDDPATLDRSVYSVAAARERRIEVVALELMDTQRTEQGTIRLIKELGNIEQDREREIPFLIRNTSATPMHLLESTADCGCTTTELPKEPIPAQGSHALSVHFSGRAPLGRLMRTLSIRTDGEPERFELIILGTVIP